MILHACSSELKKIFGTEIHISILDLVTSILHKNNIIENVQKVLIVV